MFRGLQGLSARWGELVAAAQAVMGIYQDLSTINVEQLYDENNALPPNGYERAHGNSRRHT